MQYGSITGLIFLHRDMLDQLAERGARVSDEVIRLWCNKLDQNMRNDYPAVTRDLAIHVSLMFFCRKGEMPWQQSYGAHSGAYA